MGLRGGVDFFVLFILFITIIATFRMMMRWFLLGNLELKER